MPFTESGVTLNFPDGNFFCFENCPGYRQYSGNHFKEMDAGWFDLANSTLYLVELKDFTAANLARTNATEIQSVEKRIWNLVKKSIDSCMMLASIQLGSPKALDISACLPQSPGRMDELFLVNILSSDRSQQADIAFIRTAYLDRLKPYKELFGIKRCTLLTYEQAKVHLPWVQ